MNEPYLPLLRVDSGLTTAQPGVWDDNQAQGRLKILADALDVPPTATAIHSVPDPWARVLLFDRALQESDHALHAKTLGEWRGLLALLGLREHFHFDSIEVADVRLDPGSLKPGLFSSVLARILPGAGDTLSAKASWQSFHVLRWRRRSTGKSHAFALTSPLTLVATGASYADVFDPQEVPWLQGGKLVDPIPKLDPARRLALAQWLNLLKRNLAREEGGDPSRRGELIELLSAFAEALAPKAAERTDEMLGQRDLKLHFGIFPLLTRAARSESPIVTDLRIVADRPGAPSYVLLAPTLTREFARPDHEIVAYLDETLDAASRNPTYKAASSGHYPELDANRRPLMHWCTPDFFFQSDLIYEWNPMAQGSKDADPFPGCRDVKVYGNSEGRRIVLPLSEQVVALFTADYLTKNFEVEWISTREARCTLKLQLQSVVKVTDANAAPQLENHFLSIERTFRDVDRNAAPGTEARPAYGMIRITDLPALCVWPKMKFPDEQRTGDPAAPVAERDRKNRWKRYVLFEAWRGTDREKEKEFLVRPLGAPDSSGRLVTMTDGRHGENQFQTFFMPQFPEFLVCQMPLPADRPRLSAQRPPTGLLALNQPDPITAAPIRTAALGIDFGTTGTGIYRSFEDDDIAQMSFANRLFPITGYDPSVFEQLTRELFIPGRDWSAGRILSVFQDFGKLENQPRLALRDGHVLFADEKNPASFIMGDPASIKSDLKWGDELQSAAARDFLAQLCLQSVAELVFEGAKSIDLRFSYPTAFSPHDLERWGAVWRQVVATDVQPATSVPLTTNAGGVDNREAVAATRFFSSPANPRQLNVLHGAVTLDIGGGTTDFAIWSRDDQTRQPALMAHMSVLFAGRDLFLATIKKRVGILRDLHDLVPIGTLDNKKGNAFNAQLDALVAAYGEAMLADIPFKINDNPPVEEFLSILELGLCGIAFYTGLLVGQLISAGKYKPDRTLPVFIGGNGSKLMNWCALGSFTERSVIHTRFAASLLAGARFASPDTPALASTVVQVVLSGSPKQEVAYGLVAPTTTLKVSDEYTNPVSGEHFRLLGQGPNGADVDRPWSASPDARSLETFAVEVDRSMPVFTTFLRVVNPRWSSEQVTAQIDELAVAVDGVFHTMANDITRARAASSKAGDPDPMRKEPIFILALKQLLKKKTDDWARSYHV